MNSEDQIKTEYAARFIDDLRQGYSKGNGTVADDCTMVEAALAYACGDLNSERTHEIEKHISTCKFCMNLVLDTRLAEEDARDLKDRALEVLPDVAKAIHKPIDQSSMLSFLKHAPELTSKFRSFLLSPKTMATLATASLAFIIIHYGLNDSEITDKSVMPAKKAQPREKMVSQPIKPSAGLSDKQEDIHPGSPDTHKKYESREHINSIKPLYESNPDASKALRTKRRRRPQSPLERIDISQFKLVGVVVSADANKAILESASGKGYVVQEGAFIGTNAGKIVQIDKDKIVIEEHKEDETGNLKMRRIELKLCSKDQD